MAKKIGIKDRAGIQRLSNHGTASYSDVPVADDSGSYGTEADDSFLDYLSKGAGILDQVSDAVSVFNKKENSQPKPTAQKSGLKNYFGLDGISFALVGGGVLLLVVVLLMFRKK